MKQIKSALVLISTFLFVYSNASAVNYFDASDGQWNGNGSLPGNNSGWWDSNTSTDRIWITQNVTTGVDFSIGTSGILIINIQAGASFTVTGDMSINDVIINVKEGGTLNVSGEFTTVQSDAILNIDGTMTVGSLNGVASTWNIRETGILNVNGAFRNDNAGMDFNLDGQLNVTGALRFHSGNFDISSTGVIDHDGSSFLKGHANITNDGLITTEATSIPTWGGGNFDCDGTADGGAVVFGGLARCSMCDDGTTNGGGDDGCFENGNIPANLPIELAYFNATIEDDFFVFDWKTITEENNDFFTVEYSTDLIEFTTLIDDINGAGTSLAPITYQESIASFNPGEIIYFRLKQTDFDGNFAYSPLVAVTLEANAYTGIVLRPNPNKGVFSLIGLDELVDLSVTTNKGTSVSFTSNTSNGITNVTLDNKSQGIYIIRAITDSNTLVKSFIVK